MPTLTFSYCTAKHENWTLHTLIFTSIRSLAARLKEQEGKERDVRPLASSLPIVLHPLLTLAMA